MLLISCTNVRIVFVQMYKESVMAKKQLPALSPSEMEILRLLWKLETGTVQDVCDNLPQKRQISYATVQTLLRRLEKKGYITHQTKGRAYIFIPSVKCEEVIKRTVGDFVEKLFGGDPIPLMMHLANSVKFKDKDVKRLKQLIEKEDS